MKLPISLFFSLRALSIGVQVAETRFTRGVCATVGLRANLGPGAADDRFVWNPGTSLAFLEKDGAYVSMRFLRRTWQPSPRVDGPSTFLAITPRRYVFAYGALLR